MANYVHDEHKNRIPAYSAEEFLNLLAQVIEDGDLDNVTAENAFITRLKSIANGNTYFFSVLTQAEYNALVQADELEDNTIYIISDDSTVSDLQAAIEELQESTGASISALNSSVAGLQSYVNGLGVSIPVIEDQQTGNKIAILTNEGLYACTVSKENSTSKYTLMLSIFDLSQGYTFARMPVTVSSPNDTVIEVNYMSGYGNFVFCATSDFELVDCRLIVPYKAAE